MEYLMFMHPNRLQPLLLSPLNLLFLNYYGKNKPKSHIEKVLPVLVNLIIIGTSSGC